MKKAVFVTWDDVPHLSEETKKTILAGVPPWQRAARSKGTPQLGAGAIYQVAEDDFVVSNFEIPIHWPRAYGFDIGWNMNAAIFGAWDRENDVVYVYDELYKGKTEASLIATAIKARGEWLKGVIDPASHGRRPGDGAQMIKIYRELGLDVKDADNAVEAGLTEVWRRLSEGRLRVFRSCTNLLAEYRIYRRDDKGKVVKKNDHALDALRYLIMSGLARAEVPPSSDSTVQWWNKWNARVPGVFAG